MKLSPALADLIRALAEDAVAQGYLSPEPANDAGSDANRTDADAAMVAGVRAALLTEEAMQAWQAAIARGHRAANAQPWGGLAGSGSSEPATSWSAACWPAPAVRLRLGIDDSSSRV